MTIANLFGPAEYPCADDLMQEVIKSLLQSTDKFCASKGGGTEILGASFRLTNPRARISRSEMRGKIFSALGELFWCLSGSNKVAFIEHYISRYREHSDDGGDTIHGAYGPRIFGQNELDQVRNVINLLNDGEHHDSRRAIIQIFSASDLKKHYKDVPCTCTLQVILRQGKVNFIVYMRSNDAYLGLPHDIFVFTMLQELIARSLHADVGFYQHMVGHLHLYEKDRQQAQDYLSEDVQSILPMPPMPDEDHLPLFSDLLGAEAAIRADPRCMLQSEFGSYWEDIIRLLRVYSENHHKIEGYKKRIAKIKTQMNDPSYQLYIA